MKTIFKILKQNLCQIILIIAILVCQAMLDLKLPEYTADIVDTGITNNGIDSSVPKFISSNDLATIKLLLTSDESKTIADSYQIFSEDNLGSQEFQKIKKRYAIENSEDLYYLQTDEDLSTIFNKVNVTYSLLTNEEYKEQTGNVLPLLNNMDETNRQKTLDMINEQVENNIDDLLKDSMALNTVKTYYANANISTEKVQINYIFKEGAIMLGIACLVMIFVITSTYLIARLAANIARSMRKEVVNKIMNYSNQEFENFQTSSLITRSTNDIQQVQMFIVMALRIVIYAPIMGLGAFAKVRTNQMSWILAISLLCVLSLIIILFVVALPKFKAIQNKIDKLNLISREILCGLPQI